MVPVAACTPSTLPLVRSIGVLRQRLVGIFDAAVRVGERVGEEVVGKSDLMAGEPVRDGLFEKLNGC